MHADRRTRTTSWTFTDDSRTVIRPLTEYEPNDVGKIEGRRRGLWRRRSVNIEARQDEELPWNRLQRAALRNGKPRDVLHRGERVRGELLSQIQDQRHRPHS